MALVDCPECGKENISDTAVSCPECGYAVKEHFELIRAEVLRLEAEKAVREGSETDEKAVSAQKAAENIKAEEIDEPKTDDLRKQKAIKDLEKQIEKLESGKIRLIILAVLSSIPIFISLVQCFADEFDSENSGFLCISIICWIILPLALLFIADKDDKLKKAAKDIEQIKKKGIDEYEKILEERKRVESARTAEMEALAHPKCPMCGSRNTERLGTIEKDLSVAIKGLASPIIGKQYECHNCGHLW